MEKLIIVHKTHLDVGFTDLASEVTKTYLESFIPAALRRAEEMNGGERPRFVWTTGSWLIWKALEEYQGEQQAKLEEAINKGWFVWHALPFTFHTELLTPNLLRLALKFSQDLDRRFGKTTSTAKMTDVPGHTMGMVPILAEAGIKFLHLGVNPASKVPEVPELFRWRCGEAELVTAYSAAYGSPSLCPDGDLAMTFLHTNDNLGPPSAEAIEQEEALLQARYETGEMRAGSMQDFWEVLAPQVDALPVLEAEIGDSWIHGAGTAPANMADYLAMRRVIEAKAQLVLAQPLAGISDWLEPLLLFPEHTWGVDIKKWFGDHRHYSVGDLREIVRAQRTLKLQASWEEPTQYLARALEAFPEHLRGEVEGEVAASRRSRQAPELGSAAKMDGLPGLVAGRWVVRLEPATGLIAQVHDKVTGRDLCPEPARLSWGVFMHELIGQDRYDRFLRDYMGPPPLPWWAVEDFSKLGLPPELRSGKIATLRSGNRYVDVQADRTRLVTELQFLGEAMVLESAPQEVRLEWIFWHEAGWIDLQVGWNAKEPTRYPECIWLGFRLPAGVTGTRLAKLGQSIDPAHVIAGGGRALHALDGPVQVMGENQSTVFCIEAFDSVLVAPDQPVLPCVPEVAPMGTKAVWFNLCNNIWNTNFPLWQGGAMGYRFRMEVG